MARKLRIINIMLGEKRGGLEQAAADYAEALQMEGHDVTTVIRAGAWVAEPLKRMGAKTFVLNHPYHWNLFGKRRLQKLWRDADAVILHGNRAALFTRHMKGHAKVIAVVHSRFFKILPHMDAVLVLTENAAAGVKSLPVHVVPNMTHVPKNVARPAFRQPPVIGMMGRFSSEKGVDIFIDALKILSARKVAFRALIAGAGEGMETLKARAASLGDAVNFPGWVTDKAAFFESLDIFCLPSRSETFSITLLEALAHGVPAVATDCGGPSQILGASGAGILCAIDAVALADALAQLLQDPDAAMRMGAAGHTLASIQYDMPAVSEKLGCILHAIVE